MGCDNGAVMFDCNGPRDSHHQIFAPRISHDTIGVVKLETGDGSGKAPTPLFSDKFPAVNVKHKERYRPVERL